MTELLKLAWRVCAIWYFAPQRKLERQRVDESIATLERELRMDTPTMMAQLATKHRRTLGFTPPILTKKSFSPSVSQSAVYVRPAVIQEIVHDSAPPPPPKIELPAGVRV